MKQKSRIVSKLFAALVILTLISCCFLGSTFARYTSQSTGTASVGVAKWDIQYLNANEEAQATSTTEMGKLSPSAEAWKSTTEMRENEIGGGVAMIIKNNSEVKADITVTLSAPTYVDANGDDFTGWGAGISLGADTASYDEVKNAVRIQFAVDGIGGVTADTEWKDCGETVTIEDVNVGVNVYVYVKAVWVSSDGWGETMADELDTWIGKNIAKVKADFTYTAVQASELPGNN